MLLTLLIKKPNMLIASAIKYDGKIFLGRGHSAIIGQIIVKYRNSKLKIAPQDQGFYTDDNRFLSREDACKHAIECNQVQKDNICSSVFTSEELWEQLDPTFREVLGVDNE